MSSVTMVRNYTKEDFEEIVRKYVFKKLEKIASKYGGLYKLTNCFLNVPDPDSGLNYAYAEAEGARLDIGEELSSGEIEIEILDVKFDADMKLIWAFNIYASIENTYGAQYSTHRIEANKRLLIDHDFFDEEGLTWFDEKGVKYIDWNLITRNFLKLTK